MSCLVKLNAECSPGSYTFFIQILLILLFAPFHFSVLFSINLVQNFHSTSSGPIRKKKLHSSFKSGFHQTPLLTLIDNRSLPEFSVLPTKQFCPRPLSSTIPR